jgi:hypothetical protein
LVCTRVDPRIHFALVCGAKGCPPIKVYSTSDLQNELTLAARSFLESGFQIKYNHHHDDRQRGNEHAVDRHQNHNNNNNDEGLPDVEIGLNMIMKWYKYDFISDFDERERGKDGEKKTFRNNIKLLLWLRDYLSPQKSEELTKVLKRGNFKISYLPYDWSLNA